jgi:hypothetical protein
LLQRIDLHSHALNVRKQWRQADLLQRVHIKPIGKRQLLQFRRDRLSPKQAKLATEGQVHIGALVVGALGTGPEQCGAVHLRMPA